MPPQDTKKWYQQAWPYVILGLVALFLLYDSGSLAGLGFPSPGGTITVDNDYVDTTADEAPDLDYDQQGSNGDTFVLDTEGLTVAETAQMVVDIYIASLEAHTAGLTVTLEAAVNRDQDCQDAASTYVARQPLKCVEYVRVCRQWNFWGNKCVDHDMVCAKYDVAEGAASQAEIVYSECMRRKVEDFIGMDMRRPKLESSFISSSQFIEDAKIVTDAKADASVTEEIISSPISTQNFVFNPSVFFDPENPDGPTTSETAPVVSEDVVNFITNDTVLMSALTTSAASYDAIRDMVNADIQDYEYKAFEYVPDLSEYTMEVIIQTDAPVTRPIITDWHDGSIIPNYGLASNAEQFVELPQELSDTLATAQSGASYLTIPVKIGPRANLEADRGNLARQILAGLQLHYSPDGTRYSFYDMLNDIGYMTESSRVQKVISFDSADTFGINAYQYIRTNGQYRDVRIRGKVKAVGFYKNPSPDIGAVNGRGTLHPTFDTAVRRLRYFAEPRFDEVFKPSAPYLVTRRHMAFNSANGLLAASIGV